MAKRPKYHFLTIVKGQKGTFLMALPGQTFGRTPVPDGVMVQDIGKNTILRRARIKGQPGDLFFTTSLRLDVYCLKARDIHPLDNNTDVLFSDVRDRYEDYLKTLKDSQQ